MTRKQMIKELEELARILVEEMDTDEVSDYAREHAYISITSAMELLAENAE